MLRKIFDYVMFLFHQSIFLLWYCNCLCTIRNDLHISDLYVHAFDVTPKTFTNNPEGMAGKNLKKTRQLYFMQKFWSAVFSFYQSKFLAMVLQHRL